MAAERDGESERRGVAEYLAVLPSRKGFVTPDSDDEGALLAAVAGLMDELYPGATMPPPRLDSRLDRDLGIDSLGLLELIAHLDHLFGVDLPTAVTATAETPRDLLEALRRAPVHPGTSCRAAPPPPAVDAAAGHTAGHPAAKEVATLVEVLEWHVKSHPHRCHIRLLGEAHTHPDHQRIAKGRAWGRAGAESEGGIVAGTASETAFGEADYGEMSYSELDRRARSVANALAGYGVVAGDRVALMLPTCDEYFAIFTGILLAGAVPVPIYPPSRPSQLEEHLLRQVGILANAEVSILVTTPEARRLARLVRAQVGSLKKVVIARELLVATGAGQRWDTEAIRHSPDEIALLQYTSGSTANPKGVVLTHANLLANIEAMGAAARIESSDVFVSWLPLYHDMGLIGAWLSSFYYGMVAVVMTPQAFLSRPSQWLWAMHRHGGTVSAAPNFAYELCSRRIDDAELEGLDLSSWRIAMNGSEAVSCRTLSRFVGRFARFGLKPESVTPVYGLAEAGLGLAFPPIGRTVRVDRIEQGPFLNSGRAVPSGSEDVLENVSCGMPLPGYEIRVVDISGNLLWERSEGRVEFRGPSMISGYFHNAAATRELFDGDWIDTGDLGYLADGEIFVTGRIKDLVIRAGQNLHPEGLEEAIGELDDVRKGCVAIFGVEDLGRGTERLVVVAESRATDPISLARIRAAIVVVCAELIAAAPDEIVIAPPGTVLKTSSGKIRRAATRDLYQRGRLLPTRRTVGWQLVRFTWRGARPSMRRAAGGLSRLGFAAYGWLLLGLLGTPTLLAISILPDHRRRRAVAYRSARALVRLTGTPLDVEGEQYLAGSGTFVVAANHASYLDSFVLAAVLPARATFVAGEVFAAKKLTAFFLKRLDVQFVERTTRVNAKSETSRLAALARNGTALVFFPEGGLSRSPGLRRFHQGAFVVATDLGCPVVPIAIRGTRAMVPPGSRLMRHGRLHLVVGAPVYPAGSDWHAAVDLGLRVREAIAPYCGEPNLA